MRRRTYPRRLDPSRPWRIRTRGLTPPPDKAFESPSEIPRSRSTKSPSGVSHRSLRVLGPWRGRSARAPNVWAWGPGNQSAGRNRRTWCSTCAREGGAGELFMDWGRSDIGQESSPSVATLQRYRKRGPLGTLPSWLLPSRPAVVHRTRHRYPRCWSSGWPFSPFRGLRPLSVSRRLPHR